jgi:hypothetical protein
MHISASFTREDTKGSRDLLLRSPQRNNVRSRGLCGRDPLPPKHGNLKEALFSRIEDEIERIKKKKKREEREI